MKQKLQKGHSEVLYQEEKEGLQIAPNTNFSFPTALNGQPLTPGEYHLTMTVLGNENENGKFSRKKEILRSTIPINGYLKKILQ